METVLKLLLTKHCTSNNPHIRQAACIWLLTLTKKCGQHACIQLQLKNIQVAFMGMLGESDGEIIALSLLPAPFVQFNTTLLSIELKW